MAVSDDYLQFVLEQLEPSGQRYLNAGSQPFCPYPDRPDVSMGYWQVPAEILEDSEALQAWTREALAVALAARARPRRRRKPATATRRSRR